MLDNLKFNNEHMENKKKYIFIVFILIISIFLITKIYFVYIEKNSHYDDREKFCNWKSIKSIEYNIDKKECFQTEISACQKPSFSSIEECKKLNWIK